MLAFYDRFLKNRATIASCLYQLLQKDATWRYETNHQEAFDKLKRLLLSQTVLAHYDEQKELLVSCDASPYGIGAEIARLTKQDSILQRLYKAVQDGTVEKLTGEEFTPYRRRATALAFHRECITLGSQVIIPNSARSHVLALLHAGHRGMVAMKKGTRSYIWWPGIDKVIKETVRQCRECRSTQKSPPKAPIPTWDRRQTPWHTVHVDFVGPLLGRTYLVVVDAHTKCVEVRHVMQATSAVFIDVLRSLFATFGIP
ncbi:uncharacterized protein K02A2.6-like [Dermacentor silvarum]|uniref:uncharacterized protein K02A2.6-like n=1 Tax=Dermacentor silvarum TaxID=543639 RepID=UPI002100E1A2|nr:uncharacterized protein K02A2.6-like [Dermacentor silvarum]